MWPRTLHQVPSLYRQGDGGPRQGNASLRSHRAGLGISMASPSRALAPAGGLGIGEEDRGDCDQGGGDVCWGRWRGGHKGSWVQWRKGSCLTGWTQDVQSGHVWGVGSVALGQASSTDCRGGGAVLREAGSSPPTFQGGEEADASPEVKGSPQAQAYTLLPVSRRF